MSWVLEGGGSLVMEMARSYWILGFGDGDGPVLIGFWALEMGMDRSCRIWGFGDGDGPVLMISGWGDGHGHGVGLVCYDDGR